MHGAVIVEKAGQSVNTILRSTHRMGNPIKSRPAAHGANLLVISNHTNLYSTLIAEVLPDVSATNAAFGEKEIQNIHCGDAE